MQESKEQTLKITFGFLNSQQPIGSNHKMEYDKIFHSQMPTTEMEKGGYQKYDVEFWVLRIKL